MLDTWIREIFETEAIRSKEREKEKRERRVNEAPKRNK